MHGVTFSAHEVGTKRDKNNQPSNASALKLAISEYDLVPDTRFLLMQAAAFGNLPLLQTALRAGANLNAISDDGSTALHCAARAGQLGIVEYLFQLGADIKTLNKKSRTPFQEGILGGDIPTMTYMLKNKMSAMDTKMLSLSTFETVLSKGNEEVANIFAEHLDHEMICEKQGLRMLHRAIKYSHVNSVHWLLSSTNTNINSRYNSGMAPIHHATKVGHVGVLEVLMASDELDPNNTEDHYLSYAPIHIAVEEGSLDVVQLSLRDDRVNVNVETVFKSTPLHLAVQENKMDIAKLILAHPKADLTLGTYWDVLLCIPEVQLPPLRSSDLPELLKEPTHHEDFQHAKDFNGLLFRAAHDGVSEVVGLLTRTQVFAKIIMGDDATAALCCAVCTASISNRALNYLLQQPAACVNERIFEGGMTALYVAVLINNTEAVELLLGHHEINLHLCSWDLYSGGYPESYRVKSAREIASLKYGPQSAIGELFAAHGKRSRAISQLITT
ncbi:ankyrin repeat-containing domain protein [Phaeosphaeria sp. MPI-PUGE-AT-0046c]|nr:ankyrin repeat-containing domain protein [Phaeosphaeria sp. MPI-PUGE-AT-0046c]